MQMDDNKTRVILATGEGFWESMKVRLFSMYGEFSVSTL